VCKEDTDEYPADYIKNLLKSEGDIWKSFFKKIEVGSRLERLVCRVILG